MAVFIRTIILYPVLIMVIRLMGKRQIGQLEPSEFVVTMLVANLASIPIEDTKESLVSGIIPLVTVLLLEFLLSLASLKNLKFRKVLCGKPIILMENGNILQDNLKKTRITLDELTGHLRQKDILDPRTVQYAILETNGNLSVFPFPKENPASAKDAGIQVKPLNLPITIISDGRLLTENLQAAGKTKAWVDQTLKTLDTTQQDTFLLTVDQQEHLIFYRKEI